MINKLATNLRVLSRYMEYFYPSVHSLRTDVPRLYHSLHIIKPEQHALDLCKKYLLVFQRLLTDEVYVQNKRVRYKFKGRKVDSC